MKVKNKVVVVTGGGSGIGRQLVLTLLARGARVAAVDLREEGLNETQAEAGAGDSLSLHVANVTDRERVAALPAEVIDRHGAVDALINNAGVIQPFVRLNELDFNVIDRMIDVNLHGPINLIKAFLPHLLERQEAHVANVSSMGGFLPVPGQTMYGAAKAGVKLMSEGLYAELLETNVHVSVIMPGGVATDITKNSGVDIPGAAEANEQAASRALPASEAARIIVDGIEANKLHILVGSDARMMYLASRVAPKRATHFISKQMKALLDR